MRDIKTFLAHLSPYPGVYQMLGENGEVLYIGKAKNLKKRIASYFSSHAKDPKTIALVKQIKDIDFTVTNSENEAVLLECNLIKKHRPRYNVLLRDDKSYPYIMISKHPYPRIDLYRGLRKKNVLYFGPYPNSQAVRETISLLQKIFHIRTCRDAFFAARTRPCLLYQIGRCTGPCVQLISAEDYAADVDHAVMFLEGKSQEVIEQLEARMEMAAKDLHFELAGQLRDQINRLRQIQERQYVSVKSGHADIIGLALESGIICLQLLSIRGGQLLGSRSYFPTVPLYSNQDEIMSAFLAQHYLSQAMAADSIPKEIIIETNLTDHDWLENVLSEQAQHKVQVIRPLRGEKKKWLAMATTSAKQALAAHHFNKTNMAQRLMALQQALHLNNIPERIECFDMSHSMGEATVASCVVFDREGPRKSDYRRFNITLITPGDDVAAIQQAVARRFKRLQKDKATLPDMVIIDGGKTQLAAANKAFAELNLEGIYLMAVSKGRERKPGYETLHRQHELSLHLPADSPALHFIQQIRDEAHRFAITSHRQRRDKARQQSTLQLIPGIGAKRRRDLLRYFGGVQGIAHASLDELIKVPGISRSLAERIFAILHDATL